jgi:hypothetical protein
VVNGDDSGEEKLWGVGAVRTKEIRTTRLAKKIGRLRRQYAAAAERSNAGGGGISISLVSADSELRFSLCGALHEKTAEGCRPVTKYRLSAEGANGAQSQSSGPRMAEPNDYRKAILRAASYVSRS